MKAAVVSGYGGPEVIQFKEVEKPIPKANELLVEVKATTVTVADTRIRAFDLPSGTRFIGRFALGITKPRRKILGAEFAGMVSSVGTDVSKFKPGDRVVASSLPKFGGYAEYACIPERSMICKIPEGVDYKTAVTLPIGARTALYYLLKADIEPDKRILIYGASGSVGTFTVQLARRFGADITAVCSSANTKLVQSLGATKVLDYRSPNFERQLNCYDIIFVAVDKLPTQIAINHLADNGIYLNITDPFKKISMIRESIRTKKRFIMAENLKDTSQDLADLLDLVREKSLQPVIDRVYAFEELPEAHRYVDSGRKKGNVVISLG
ncbi:MAG TPA: NAD(P)-dependent alcohol dehydrogenase [Balneolaceae bacterium]|nr:NAD(P)-dependent alcohol dehydrogenase [Balneolaceae bacterium]|tara:strand:+ start:71505 stop:72476 length:972 start_codon:yes stop_codon:yes gene_type:complete